MGDFRTGDGRRLHLWHWPARGVPRLHGTVQVVHGLGEHMGRYVELAGVLNAAGWHVVGHDQWGHGRSDGARGSLPRPDLLLHDLAAARDHAPCEGRVVLLGHSLGGLVAARFVAQGLSDLTEGEGLASGGLPAWQRGVDGLVLSSPAFDIGLGGLQRVLLGLLGTLAPGLPLSNGLDPQWISSDPAVVQAYVADPLVHKRITPALVRFMVDAAGVVIHAAPHWRVPTLLQWAGADRCVRPAGSERFAAAAPPALLRTQCFEGLQHEIYREPQRQAVFAKLKLWLAQFEAD